MGRAFCLPSLTKWSWLFNPVADIVLLEKSNDHCYITPVTMPHKECFRWYGLLCLYASCCVEGSHCQESCKLSLWLGANIFFVKKNYHEFWGFVDSKMDNIMMDNCFDCFHITAILNCNIEVDIPFTEHALFLSKWSLWQKRLLLQSFRFLTSDPSHG